MPIPEIDPSQDIDLIAEAQLQEELRSLFVIDTEHYLQKYSQIAQSLQAQSWRTDIQELYRCIHTIKGGAVTVGYEAVLQIATALEDVLSNLRYLEQAPSLTDGHLSKALLEAGELLSITTQFQLPEILPLQERILELHQEIQQRYLPQWNTNKQLHQEFAQQGLDMVVLELEIALEQLPTQGKVPDSTLQTAQTILEQLEQIGEELQFATGWRELLQQAQILFNYPENVIWQSHWSLFFEALKTCAKQEGNPVDFEFPSFDLSYEISGENLPVVAPELITPTNDDPAHQPDSLVENIQNPLPPYPPDNKKRKQLLASPLLRGTGGGSPRDASQIPNLNDLEPTFLQQDLEEVNELDAIAGIGAFLDEINLEENATNPQIVDFGDVSPLLDLTPLTEIEQPLEQLEEVNNLTNFQEVEAVPELDNLADIILDFGQVQEWLDQSLPEDFDAHSFTSIQEQNSATDELLFLEPPPVVSQTKQSQPEQSTKAPEIVQIPVPLEKLDQSAQHLVETILALRSTQGFYQALQNQITQLVTLAQESVQAITDLRQLQDDYVLLDQLSNNTPTTSKGPTLERYRQGYAIINRLLETNLRLSEIGAETGKTSQQVTQYLRNVDNNVLKLQNTIEDSRLVSFQNVSVRAKAILRELTIRFGKPAQLVVQGEQTELDVNTSRDLEPALLHLIRNAYDHGLESSSERIAKGKPEQGKITISLQRQGNLFQLELEDDGRGIDAQAVQAKAQALGLPLISTQTPAEILAVICQPGFSSQSQVSEISGRGIGMDVVASQVARLGGRLTLETNPGFGTKFRLKFPVSRLLVSCLLLRSGDFTFAIPVDGIKTINLLSNLNMSPVKDANEVFSCMIDGETGSLPALDLIHYWQPHTGNGAKPRLGNRSFTDTTVALCIYGEEAQQEVWLLVDELLEQSDILINPLPQPLVAPDGLIGVSLQTNGTLFPVLEASKLVERLLSSGSKAVDSAPIPPSEPAIPDATSFVSSILIVDDAALMRRRLEATLNTYGYLTDTCADGQEAWNWLQTHPHPNLVITDIEMPNMDGFTLVNRCRQSGITVPILVISSRLSEDWFDEAKRLGANDYLTKGFASMDLIKKVRVLLNSAITKRY
jgi:chemotaxis protein histidine kinase CheA